MAIKEQENNPYNICSWRHVSECEDCPIIGRLKCRYNLGDLLRFIGLFLLFLIPSLIGMIQGGYGWCIFGWIGFWIIFFEFWEIRIVCCHCPYYAEKSLTLHCIANYGSLKVWKYHPKPISKSEKIQLVVGFIILGGYPFAFLILGRQFILSLVALLGLIIFFWILQKYTCARCVNFSCVLNRVPKEVIDEYLKRNPIMKKAWEENGWQMGGKTT